MARPISYIGAFVRTKTPENMAERARYRVAHRARALLAIENDPRFNFLKMPSLKNSILIELGTFPTLATVRDAALVVCENRLTAQRAIPWLREKRKEIKKRYKAAELKRKNSNERIENGRIENVTDDCISQCEVITWRATWTYGLGDRGT